MTQSRRRRARLARIAVAVLGLAAIAVIGIAFAAWRSDAVSSIEGRAFTHIAGQRVALDEPVFIERRDGDWVAASSSESFVMDGRPLYLEQTGEVMFGDGAMCVLPARQGAIRRIPARTVASTEGGLGVVTSHNGDAEVVESGFIFDGTDTYTLLFETRLVTSAGEILLPAMSSIEATYGGVVYIYNHGSDAMQAVETRQALALVDDGTMTYEIDLLSDAVVVDGESQLLLASAFSMPSIFESV